MLGTSLRSLSPETLCRLRELVEHMRAEKSELYKEIENNLLYVAEQCNSFATVVQRLRQIRLKRRITLEEIAKRTNITRQSLRLLENSPLANPQVHTLQRYALALGHELKIKAVQKRRGTSAVNERLSTTEGNDDERSNYV